MSVQYTCDIDECYEEAYPLTFEAMELFCKVYPHIGYPRYPRVEHLCLECLEEYADDKCPIFLDSYSGWIEVKSISLHHNEVKQ